MNIEALQNALGECEICEHKICIKADKIRDALLFVKNHFTYQLLKSITAVDYGDNIEIIYHLYSMDDDESVIFSSRVCDEIESVADIFESAKADENEIYDMFGVVFKGNPDLKRIYMPENWEGYPLKKDYVQNDTRLAWNDNNDNNA